MDRLFNQDLFSSRSARLFPVLSFVWLLGLLMGTAVILFHLDSIRLLFCELPGCDLSLRCLVFTSLLPFALTFLTACLRRPWLLIPVVFCEAFLLAFICAGFFCTFDVAGWLLCIFFAAQEMFLLPLLWFLWIRTITDPPNQVLPYGIPVLVITVLICLLCVYSIEPFGAALI